MAEKRTQRRLAAILAADVVGYSRLMEHDEAGTLAALKARRSDVLAPVVAQHNGRVVKVMGDGVLVEFGSAVDAVQCAVELQKGFAGANQGLPEAQHIILRIGVNLGDVIVEGQDIYGDGVNVATRLEGLAEPGSIYVSGTVHDHVSGKLMLAFDDLGERTLKNVAKPVKVYRAGSVWADKNTARPAPALPDKPSIAVLPFQNMSGDAEQDYFADGVVEDIITALSRFRALFVIAANSSFTYKVRTIDTKHIGRELGVRYLLEGSIRKAGGRLRITAQLVEAATGAHLWSDHYDGSPDDIFEFQDRITESAVAVVAPQIQAAELARARRERPDSLEVYDVSLQARALVTSERQEEYAIATAMLVAALERSPNDGRLLAQAARALEHRIILGWPSLGTNDAETCIDYARRALERAEGDADVLAICGLSLIQVAKEYEWGMAVLRSALESNPNSLTVVTLAGIGHLHCGSVEDAKTCFHRAARLSPRDPWLHGALCGLAHAHMICNDFDAALDWAMKALAVNANWNPTYWMLVAANAHLGRMEPASRYLKHLLELVPGVTIDAIRSGQPSYDPERMAAIYKGLQIAGLPD